MATLIFKDIEDFKTYVGGAANVSVEMDSLGPIMLMTAETHLLPWLGRLFWNSLVQAVKDDNLSLAQSTILPYICRPLAMLTMYDYSAIGGIQFSESGITRVETDNMKSAFKYQEADYRDKMLNFGYEALELMLLELDDKKDDHPLWQDNEGFIRNRSLVINYASELRTIYAKYLSRYTFEMLRSLIDDLEQFALIPCMGEQQYDRLKEGILAADLNDDETKLLYLAQKAIGHFAIYEGTRRLWIKIEGAQVVQTVQRSIDARQQSLPAEGPAVSLQLEQADLFANRHISRMLSFLDANTDQFPLYQTYLDEKAAAEEAAAATEDQMEVRFPPDDYPLWKEGDDRVGLVNL